MVRAIVLALGAVVWATFAGAQQLGWVQIEARPSQPQAMERAQDYAAQLPNVNSFALPSGWYAIALGPYDPVTAEQELRRLRARGAIPGDSFVSDGLGFGRRIFGDGLLVQPETIAAEPPRDLAPPEETIAQSRAAERQLSRENRAEVQQALQWDGFYTAAIDASFGPGTRRAMEAWQLSNAYEPTGVLSTAQRRELLTAYREALASLGMNPVVDTRAGIEIDMPTAMVEFSRYEAPFSHYDSTDGGGVRVLLISQAGDEDTLSGLYDIMQTLEIVPLDGPRNRGPRSFTLTGANDDIVSTTYAEVSGGAVKGFTLIWPAGDEKLRTRALQQMRASFTPTAAVLPDMPVASADQGVDLLSGLRIRQPERTRSGFYVSADGKVVTSADAVAGCARVLLNGETEAQVAATSAELGIALLDPAARLAPISHARLQAGVPRLQSEVAVAGFPYGGVLTSPTLTYGTLSDIRGLGGEQDLTRLALVAEAGEAGGPVLDSTGSVLGVLLAPKTDGSRRLPPEVSFAADATALATFLSENGVSPAASERVETMAPEDLTTLAAEMTVLVTCWD